MAALALSSQNSTRNGFLGLHTKPALSTAQEIIIERVAKTFLINPLEIETFLSASGDYPIETFLDGVSDVGVEIEGFSNTPWTEEFGDEGITIYDEEEYLGSITGEANEHTWEINMRPEISVNDAVAALQRMEKNLPASIYLLGERPPSIGETRWVESGAKGRRYKAIREGVQKESVHGKELDRILDAAALHFHLDIDPLTEAGLELFNFYTGIAPILEDIFAKAYAVAHKHRNWRHWCAEGHPWARQDRLPGYRRFGSPDEMIRAIADIPRLIKEMDGGEYVVDGEYLSREGAIRDELHLGTIWWLVRLTSMRLLEIRFLPSLPLGSDGEVDGGIATALKILLFLGARRDDLTLPSEAEWNTYFRGHN